jgi:hypothetical protein
MAVEHEHSLLRVAGHPHQHPLRAMGGIRGVGRIREARWIREAGWIRGIRVRGVDEGDLEGAVTVPGAMPDLRGRVYAELGDRGLPRGLAGHGFLATPQ